MAAAQELAWQLAPDDAAAQTGEDDEKGPGGARWVSTRQVG
jgi:hypothetical protein